MPAAGGVKIMQVECGVLDGVPVTPQVAAALPQGADDDDARG
jgi:hypothetical protein